MALARRTTARDLSYPWLQLAARGGEFTIYNAQIVLSNKKQESEKGLVVAKTESCNGLILSLGTCIYFASNLVVIKVPKITWPATKSIQIYMSSDNLGKVHRCTYAFRFHPYNRLIR